MLTHKNIATTFLLAVLSLQIVQVTYAQVTVNGVTYSNEWLADPNNGQTILNYLREHPVDGVAPLSGASLETQRIFIQARNQANIAATVYNPNSNAVNNLGDGNVASFRTNTDGSKCLDYGNGECLPVTTGNGKVNSGYNNPNSQYVVGANHSDRYICNAGSGVTPENVNDAVKAGVCTLVVLTSTGNATGNAVNTAAPNTSREQGISSRTVPFVGIQATTSSSTLITDEDPSGTTSSCIDLTSTSLRYQAKDADTNNEVTALQTFLNDAGFLPTVATGFFGSGTVKAVKAFQKANSINATGYVGPNTRAAVKRVSCSSTSSGSATLQDNYIPVASNLPAGCTSSSGYSRTTGQKCVSTLPEGCDSTSGYSVTTGVKCSQ
mgnify:FL=1